MKKFTNTSEKSALTLSKVLKDGKLRLAAGESIEIKENQLRAGYENITNLFEDLSIVSVDVKPLQSKQDIQDKADEEKKAEELKAKELEAEKLRLLEAKQQELAKEEEANRKMAELEEKKLKEIQNQKELENQKKSEKVLTDKQEEIKA